MEGDIGGEGEGGVGSEAESENEEIIDDTDFLVQEAINRVPLGDVSIDYRQCDMDEDVLVEDFILRGCGCMKWNGKCCSRQFTSGS